MNTQFETVSLNQVFYYLGEEYMKINTSSAIRKSTKRPAAFGFVANVIVYTEDIIEAGLAVLQARDFCGNEMEALIEWEKENRRLTPQEHKDVAEFVAMTWANSKLEAKQ